MTTTDAARPTRYTVPAGPRGAPLVGVMNAMIRDPLGMMTRVARDYGPIARYRLANLTIYQVNEPLAIEHILQDGRAWDKGSFQIEAMLRAGGSGLLMAEGESWLARRRLMGPVFHARHLPVFAAAMAERCAHTAEAWSRLEESATLDVGAEMMHLTLDVAARTLFSSTVPVDVRVIDRAMKTIVEDISFRFEAPLYPPLAVPLPRNRRFLRAVADLEGVVFALIDGRRGRLEAGDAPDDLLTLLISARDVETGEGLTRRELRDEVITLLLASHETTAVLLSWCWHLLGRHDDARERLVAELRGVLGDRPPRFEDLPALRYVRAVLDETLRLYPPAWISSRSARTDDVVLGYTVPAGSVAWLSPWVVHRSPDLWPDPERFDPERFLRPAGPARPRYAYFPFGGGGYLCIGRDFALMEATLVLAVLARRHRL